MARPKKPATPYAIDKAETDGWLVRLNGVPVATFTTKDQAEKYVGIVGR